MNLNVIRTLTIKSTMTGAAETAKGLSDVAKGQEQVAVQSDKATKSTMSVEKSLERLQRQLDSTYKSQQRMAEVQRTLDRARAQGLVSFDRHNQLMSLAQSQTMKLSAANDNLAKASQAASQILGRVGINLPAFSAGVGVLGGFAAALGAVAVASGAAIEAFRKQEEASLALNAVIKATGMSAGITEKDVEELADSIGNISAVRDAATQLLTFKSIAGDTFKRVLVLADDLAAAGFGNLQSSALALAKALENPAQGLSRLARVGIQFTDAQTAAIQKMMDLGKVAEAQGAILDVVAKKMGGAGAARDQGLSGAYEAISDASQRLQEAWGKQIVQATGLTAAINAVAAAMRNSAKVFSDPLAAIDAQIASNRRLLDMFPEWMKWLPIYKTGVEEINQLQQQRIAILNALSNAEMDASDARKEGIANAEREKDKDRALSVKNVVDALHEEMRVMRLSAVEREIETKLREANVQAGSAEAEAIAKVVRAKAAEAGFKSAIDDIRARTAATEVEIAAMGMSTEQAAAYRIEQEKLAQITATGATVSEQHAAAIKQQAAEFGAAAGSLKRLQDAAKSAEDNLKLMNKQAANFERDLARAFEIGLSGFITDLAQGVSLSEALAANMAKIAQSLIQAGSTQISKSLTSSFGQTLGGGLAGGLGGGFAAVGIGVAIMGLTELLKDNSEEQEKVAAATKKFNDELIDLSNTINGTVIGTIQAQANAFTEQAEQIAAEAQQQAEQAQEQATGFFEGIWDSLFGDDDVAVDMQAQSQYQQTLNDINAFIEQASADFRESFETSIASLSAGMGFSEVASEIEQFGVKLREFIEDTKTAFGGDQTAIDAAVHASLEMSLSFITGADAMSDTEREMLRIIEAAQAVTNVLLDLGYTADQVAEVVNNTMIAAFENLRQKMTDEFNADINEMSGRGWINDINEALEQFSEGRLAGVDPTTLTSWLSLTAQGVVDSAQLTGTAFQDLITQFPELNGLVREYNDALDESAIAAQEAARAANEAAAAQQASNLQMRLLRATTDSSTLGGALTLFDAQSALEMQQAIADAVTNPLLAANLPLLEQSIAAERANIIADFADRAIAEERRAAEERQRALEDAQRTLDAFARSIQAFIDSTLAGAQSPLTPAARLAAAQSAFSTQVGIIGSGTPAEVRAAMDSITSYAQDLIDSGFAFHGSSAAGQTNFNSVIATLQSLPDQISVQELILQATTDQTTAVTGAVSTLQTQLINVLNTGDLDAIRTVLQAELPSIDTNTDNAISFTELQNALGGTYSAGTLRGIFDNLDGNGNGILEKSELIRTATTATATDVASIESLTATANTLQSTANTLVTTTNSLVTTTNSLNTSQNSILTAIQGLQNTASSQLTLLNTNFGLTTSVVGVYGAPTGAPGAIGNPVSLTGTAIDVLRKIAFNTAAIANNTTYLAPGTVSSGVPLVFGAFAAGGILGAGGFGIFGEHHPDGPWLMRAGQTPISISPSLPAGANDNSLLAEVRALRAEVARLVRVEVAAAEHVGGKVEGVSRAIADGARKAQIAA